MNHIFLTSGAVKFVSRRHQYHRSIFVLLWFYSLLLACFFPCLAFEKYIPSKNSIFFQVNVVLRLLLLPKFLSYQRNCHWLRYMCQGQYQVISFMSVMSFLFSFSWSCLPFLFSFSWSCVVNDLYYIWCRNVHLVPLTLSICPEIWRTQLTVMVQIPSSCTGEYTSQVEGLFLISPCFPNYQSLPLHVGEFQRIT